MKLNVVLLLLAVIKGNIAGKAFDDYKDYSSELSDNVSDDYQAEILDVESEIKASFMKSRQKILDTSEEQIAKLIEIRRITTLQLIEDYDNSKNELALLPKVCCRSNTVFEKLQDDLKTCFKGSTVKIQSNDYEALGSLRKLQRIHGINGYSSNSRNSLYLFAKLCGNREISDQRDISKRIKEEIKNIEEKYERNNGEVKKILKLVEDCGYGIVAKQKLMNNQKLRKAKLCLLFNTTSTNNIEHENGTQTSVTDLDLLHKTTEITLSAEKATNFTLESNKTTNPTMIPKRESSSPLRPEDPTITVDTEGPNNTTISINVSNEKYEEQAEMTPETSNIPGSVTYNACSVKGLCNNTFKPNSTTNTALPTNPSSTAPTAIAKAEESEKVTPPSTSTTNCSSQCTPLPISVESVKTKAYTDGSMEAKLATLIPNVEELHSTNYVTTSPTAQETDTKTNTLASGKSKNDSITPNHETLTTLKVEHPDPVNENESNENTLSTISMPPLTVSLIVDTVSNTTTNSTSFSVTDASTGYEKEGTDGISTADNLEQTKSATDLFTTPSKTQKEEESGDPLLVTEKTTTTSNLPGLLCSLKGSCDTKLESFDSPETNSTGNTKLATNRPQEEEPSETIQTLNFTTNGSSSCNLKGQCDTNFKLLNSSSDDEFRRSTGSNTTEEPGEVTLPISSSTVASNLSSDSEVSTTFNTTSSATEVTREPVTVKTKGPMVAKETTVNTTNLSNQGITTPSISESTNNTDPEKLSSTTLVTPSPIDQGTTTTLSTDNVSNTVGNTSLGDLNSFLVTQPPATKKPIPSTMLNEKEGTSKGSIKTTRPKKCSAKKTSSNDPCSYVQKYPLLNLFLTRLKIAREHLSN